MAEKEYIGKYKITGKVGEGGMGKILKAIHPTLQKTVIIKQLRITRSKSILTKRFQREAALMIDFRHENIVPVYDHFKEGVSYYIAMEYVDGQSLAELIKARKQIPPMAAILIFNEVCKGLDYAHEKGVIHRDIKPDNVLISNNGEVKLVDFGIATAQEESDDNLTKTGVVMGTPAYMSPEQLSSTKNVDKRTDIYSMGVMLYQMLTGERPFSNNFSAESISQITRGEYVKPKKHKPNLPKLFNMVIKKTMNHRVHKRYKNLKHLIATFSQYTYKYKDQKEINSAIKRYLDEKPQETSVFTTITKRKRKRAFLLKAALILGVLGAASFFAYSQGYYYEYIQPGSYGSVEIQLKIPEGYFLDLDTIQAQALILADAQNAKSDKQYRFILKPWPRGLFLKGEETIQKKILTTGKVYLPYGPYNIELMVGNNSYQSSFFLNSRVIQKKSDSTTINGKIITLNPLRSQSKPLKIYFAIRDGLRHNSIIKSTQIFFKVANTKKTAAAITLWRDWRKFYLQHKSWMAANIKSGRYYYFKFETPQYQTKVLNFYIPNEMDYLNLDVDLIKKPGKLVIHSNSADLSIMVDNQRFMRLKNFTDGTLGFGKTVAGKKEFFLPEGNYYITVKKSDKIIENQQFTLKTNETVQLNVNYDEQKKSISITVSK